MIKPKTVKDERAGYYKNCGPIMTILRNKK